MTSTPADADPNRAARRRGPPLLAMIPVVLAALVALYAALGFWVAPRVARHVVIDQIAQRYHRKATLAEVRFNPFTFLITARDFSLPDADGRTMIAFHGLTLRPRAAALLTGAIDFQEIGLVAPRLRVVVRRDGKLNLADLIPPDTHENRKPEPPPRLTIARLSVKEARIDGVDEALPSPFSKSLAPADFTLTHFNLVRGPAGYAFDARTDKGERLSAGGDFSLSPLASSGRIMVGGLKVAPLAALAKDALPFTVTSGDLDLSAVYRFALPGGRLALTLDAESIRLAGAGLRARAANADWITLPLLTATGVHVDAPGRLVRVAKVEATGLAVTAWREKTGAINLAQFAPPASASSEATGSKEPPWRVEAPDLVLKTARVDFEERSADTPLKIHATPLNLEVTGLKWPDPVPVLVDFATGLDEGARLSAKGKVDLIGLAADLDVNAADIGLTQFQPYIDDVSAFTVESGAVSAKGHVILRPGAAVRFAGSAQIDRLHTTDDVLDEDFINWRALKIDGISATTQPLAVNIETITAQDAYAKVVIEPTYVTNVQTVIAPKSAAAVRFANTPPPAPAKAGLLGFGPVTPKKPRAAPAVPPPTAAAGPALPVEIGLVKVVNGRMDFTDLSLQPNFSTSAQALNGTVKGLSGRAGSRAVVDLNGQVDRYAPLKINGQINPFAAAAFTDIGMDFQNMELTTFSPYSGKFAGYRVKEGKLNVTLHYNIQDQKLNATHRVVIRQLQLGDKVDSADATKLPVKLIVALLKDRHGVIDIPIDISGTLDDPKFRIWPVIWKVLGNLLEKIVTSPFALLGKLGGHGDEIQFVDFAPGAAVVDETGKAHLAAIAKGLDDRPALNLEIPMTVDPAADRPALLAVKFQAELDAAAKSPRKHAIKGDPASDPHARRALLEDLYRRQFGSAPKIPKPPEKPSGGKAGADEAADAWLETQLRAKVIVTDADLTDLARARAQAVQSILLDAGKVDPARVFLITAPPVEGPIARMTLSLR